MEHVLVGDRKHLATDFGRSTPLHGLVCALSGVWTVVRERPLCSFFALAVFIDCSFVIVVGANGS